MKLKRKIAFIGSGRMAEALISGLISAKVVTSKDILAADKESSRLRYLAEKYKIKIETSNCAAAQLAEIIILSIKPQVMREVLNEIRTRIKSEQLVISIAAGITLKTIERYLPQAPVIRAMPNNPAFVGEGLTAICKGHRATERDRKVAEVIFGAVGKVIAVEEKLMDAVTGLSGSGPAFIYAMVESLIEGGVEAGLSETQAKTLAVQTTLGAAKTMAETGKDPAELREMVTSPGGTTIAGLRVLEEGKFKKILRGAVVAATKRAKELSEEYEK